MNEILMGGLACLPILWLIVSLMGSFIKTWMATVLALVMTLILALFLWRMPVFNAATAIVEGMAVGMWPIALVVITAIFTYNLSVKTKNMDIIKKMLSGISTDPRIQVLVLAWGFGGFLEAISGYGTSVAIPASIMIVIGFQPVTAAVICLVANTVPTAFGAVGVAVTTLAKLTGLPIDQLSFMIALQLSPLIVIVPFVLVAVAANGIKGIRGVFGITLASGVAFVIPQLLAARFLGEQLPTLLGSLCSLMITILLNKAFYKKAEKKTEYTPVPLKKSLLAWMPYLLIMILILLTSPVFPGLHDLAASVQSSVTIYQGEGAKPTVFQWLTFPGTLIFVSAVISALANRVSIKDIILTLWSTVKQMSKSVLTILSIVSLAKVMTYSGMIASLAHILVITTGRFFPLVSPIIGMLGTFMTGSDTSSNVLFGNLQQKVATSIHVDPNWLASANTAGATAGKMISPQSIVVATSSTGMERMENKIFRRTLVYCLFYIPIISIIVYIGSGVIK